MTISPAISLLWSDDALLVIDKPAGLATLPDGYDSTLPHVKSVLEPIYGKLWIVHRLDKETSGVLVLARTAEAHRSLNLQFEQHKVNKCYHALVCGSPSWEEYTVRQPLRLNGDRKHRTVMDVRRGKPSITHLRVLERFDSYTLVEACPETGRRHQIRAHLAALGFPIAGDDLYGNRLSSPIDRSSTDSSQESLPGDLSLALHARALEFTHPIHGDRLWLEAPYPMQFQNTLRGLRSAPRPFRKQLVITHKYSPRTGKGAKKRKIGS